MRSISLFPLLLCVVSIVPVQASDLAIPSFEPDKKETAGLVAPHRMGESEGVDPELAALKTVRIQRPEHLASVAEARAARQAEARVWLEQAGRLRSYRERAVSPKNFREARRLEYMALLNAEKNGDEAEKERRGQLLEEIRRDTTVPAAQRCEAVARAKYFELSWQKTRATRALEKKSDRIAAAELELMDAGATLSPKNIADVVRIFDGRLGDYAEIERSLIAEFPDAPNGYEGLLNVARDSSSEQGAVIVAELLAMETTPSEVKTQAVILQARYAIIGRPASMLAPALNLATNKETWLFSWSKHDTSSLSLGWMLVDRSPATVDLVCISLDRSVPAIESLPPDEQPPGRIVQDDGNLSAALVMTGPRLAYAIGEDGCVRSVTLLNELCAMRAAANHEGEAK